MTLIIRGGKIIDGTGGEAFTADVLVDNGRIERIGQMAEADYRKARVIDACDRTVIPGLIDTHVHMTWGETLNNPRRWNAFTVLTEKEAGFMTLAAKAARDVASGAYSARATLRAGFTTVRDVGMAAGYSDIVLREAVRNGFIRGPRILACGGGIAMTGGHGWDVGVKEVDGPDALRAQTRLQIKAGADVIKIFATAAGLALDDPGGPEFSIEEMRVVCEEAHQRGRRVAAHAVGTVGIKRAILAGVDTIEHGCLIDEECADLMVERGTFLISTLHPFDRQARHASNVGYPEYAATISEEIMRAYPQNLRMAVAKGVRVALGSDSGIPDLTPHGENAREIVLFHELVGESATSCIRRATALAAEALGIERVCGTIESGKQADIVVVDGDLEQDMSLLVADAGISAVIQQGELLVEGGRWMVDG